MNIYINETGLIVSFVEPKIATHEYYDFRLVVRTGKYTFFSTVY